jgi:hypothetical protein
MRRTFVLVFLAGMLLVTAVLAGGTPLSVATAVGTIDKADSETLTIKPRDPDGKFAKHITLKVTGTSKISSLSQEKRAGKLVFVQREIPVKELEPNQPIAVIYGMRGKELVLLSAVVQPGK